MFQPILGWSGSTNHWQQQYKLNNHCSLRFKSVQVCWSWNGQRVRLLLRRSEFESRWSLEILFCKAVWQERINKKRPGWPIFEVYRCSAVIYGVFSKVKTNHFTLNYWRHDLKTKTDFSAQEYTIPQLEDSNPNRWYPKHECSITNQQNLAF